MINSIKQGFHHKLNKVHGVYSEKPHLQAKHRALFYGIPLGILLIIATVAGLYMVTYGDKASPATYLSGVDVSGKTRSEIKFLSHNLFDEIELTLKNDDKTVVASAKEIGLTLKDDASADEVIETGLDSNIFVRFNPFWRKDAALQVDCDYVAMQEYLNQQFADVTIVPRDSTIVYNETSAQFDVVPGSSGKIISADELKPAIDELLVTAGSADIDVKVVEADPKVSVESAEKARDYMNVRVDLRLNLNYQGQLLYFIDPPDIAAWADIAPNPTTGQLDVEFDKAKMQLFLTDKVAPSLAAAPVDEKILVNDAGQELMVVQHGRNGRQPRDMSQLVDQVYNATVAGVNLDQELDLAEAAYKTTRIVTDDTNWVEVNLSNQTAMLWNGTQLLRTFVISSGVAKWPTVTGDFRIWYKTPSQTMTGGSRADGSYYDLPNVTWVSYFYQDYGFHTKYWNNIFGAPSSHGCVNMREADAKILYDFAPVGTRVVVHY